MKKVHYLLLCTLFTLVSCSDFLDLEPRNKILPNQLFATSEGIQAHLANLYGRLPIEDFNYSPNRGFNIGMGNEVNNGGFMAAHYCDEAIHPEYNDWGEERFDYWEEGYKLIRDVNSLLEIVPTLTIISENEKKKLNAEAYFLRAYTYFALARRYGGVPLIEKPQEYEGNIESLKVSRSTEKATWDFILADCDRAVAAFEWIDDQTLIENNPRRGDKWATLALKSRAALFAASVAKFSHQPYVSFSGPAVEQHLAGIEAIYADEFYSQCIDASEKIMESGKFGLYKPTPADPTEAATNYQKLFEHPSQCLDGVREPIFIKSYVANTSLAHNYDVWFSPRQTNLNLFPGRMNPTLEFIDSFEDYTDDGQGKVKPIQTRTDGNENDYNGFGLSTDYLTFPKDNPFKAFEGRDARLNAMVLFPGQNWGSTKIIIQGGLVKSDGSGYYYRTQASEKGQDGLTYYTYGAENGTLYSGFDPTLGHYTRSGFLFKKFMQIENPVEQEWSRSTQDWIDYRYGEILLNYAEAIIEKSEPTSAEIEKGKKALNEVRKRAAHKDEIALTQSNVRKERFVELAFENKRRWDLIRWRTFHKEFQTRTRKGLVPFIDLRKNPPCYIFVRVNPLGLEAKTFEYSWYYKDIPGIESNGLVQNP